MILILNQQSEYLIPAEEKGVNHLIEGDEEEKKDFIEERMIDVMTLKRKKILNLKKSLKIINLLKKKENFQNEDKILEIKFPLLRCDFVDPIDQL